MPLARRFPPPWSVEELDARGAGETLYSPLTSITPARPCGMFALSDSQLRALWVAADGIPVEKRGIFLGRFIALLQLHGDRFTTADLEDAVRLALKGLSQKSAA
jgi:hypothetical protein